MECKAQPGSERSGSDQVLIETLWNVKSNSNRNANFCVSVLIETLWNVKLVCCA